MSSSDFTETSTVSSRRRAPCEGRQPKITRNVYVVRRVLQSRQSRKTREPHPTSPKEKQQSLLLVFSKLVAFVFLAEGKEKKKKSIHSPWQPGFGPLTHLRAAISHEETSLELSLEPHGSNENGTRIGSYFARMPGRDMTRDTPPFRGPAATPTEERLEKPFGC